MIPHEGCSCILQKQIKCAECGLGGERIEEVLCHRSSPVKEYLLLFLFTGRLNICSSGEILHQQRGGKWTPDWAIGLKRSCGLVCHLASSEAACVVPSFAHTALEHVFSDDLCAPGMTTLTG